VTPDGPGCRFASEAEWHGTLNQQLGLLRSKLLELNVHPTWNFRWIFHLTWNFAAWCAAGTGQTAAFGRGCVKTAKQSLSRFDPDIVNPFSFSQAHKARQVRLVWLAGTKNRVSDDV
jgi:hypothetical protein